jgi:hypothetical protein
VCARAVPAARPTGVGDEADQYDTDVYGELLTMLGCRNMTPARVAEHVDALATTFDAADAMARTPRTSSDRHQRHRMTNLDRRESRTHSRRQPPRTGLLDRGNPCALSHDSSGRAPELQRAHAPAFDAVLANLGIHSSDVLRSRGEAVIQFLPRL